MPNDTPHNGFNGPGGQESPSLRERMFSGAGWMIGARLAHRGIGIVSTLVLVRLLVPSDFGLMAMATSIIAMVELLNAFGFDVMLIQRQNASRRHFDTAWTLSILFAGLVATVLVVLAAPGARFYGEPRLEPVIYLLALSTTINGFQNIGVVQFRKELQYRKDFLFMVGVKLTAFAATIPLAFLLRSYWALAIGLLVSSVGSVIFSYVYSPYRPRLSLDAAAEVMSYSKWVLLNSIANFLRTRLVDFIVGRGAGAGSLGTLSVSQEIATVSTIEVAQPINRAAMPIYAKVGTDLAALRRGYLGVISAVTLIVAPAGVGVALTAPLLVPLLLGEAWTGAIVLIQILAIMGTLQAMQSNSATVYYVLGRVRLLTVLTVVSIPIMLILVVGGTAWRGVEGAAMGLLGTVVIMLPVNYTAVCRVLKISFREVLRAVWRPLASVGVMTIACSWSYRALPASLATTAMTIRLIELVLLGGATYVLSLVSLWLLAGKPDGGERFVLDRLLKFRGLMIGPTA